MDERERVCSIQRTAQFDRSLEDLRRKGGTAGTAAKKAIDFISAVMGNNGRSDREKYSFTRNGEARIRRCRKVDLGGGYRLICLFKDGAMVLLYAGSHDECSRWLMRNRRMQYEFAPGMAALSASSVHAEAKNDAPAGPEEGPLADDYEEELMGRIDDAVLRRVFSGLVHGRT